MQNMNCIAITKQNIIRLTVSKLWWEKLALRRNFYAVNDRFLLTYLLIRLIDNNRLLASINQFLK